MPRLTTRKKAKATMRASSAILLALLLSACGSAIGDARSAIEVAADAGAEADRTVARLYLREHSIAMSKAQSFAEYQRLMGRFDLAADAIETYRAALVAAEAALDAYESAADSPHWAKPVGCVFVAALRLIHAFEVAGIDAPGALKDAAKLGASFAPRCSP